MELATLLLKVDATGAVRSVKEFNTELGKTEKEASNAEKWAKRAGVAIGAAFGAAAIMGVRKLIEETKTAQYAQAQLAAALKSTAGASGQTIQSLNSQAAALANLTTYGDDAIASAQSLLLTFTKISGDTFPKATAAILDMSTRMGGDLKGAAVQLGKALNDPVEGISALSRVGVSFDDSQKAVIKRLVETNQLASAQAIILKELQVEFGGSAEAARNTLGGALEGLSNAWGDLFEMSSEATSGIVAQINRLARALPSVADEFGRMVAVVGIKATELQILLTKSDRAIAMSNTAIYAGINAASGGALGGQRMVLAAAEAARLTNELDALGQLLEQQELGLAAIGREANTTAAAFERLADAAAGAGGGMRALTPPSFARNGIQDKSGGRFRGDGVNTMPIGMRTEDFGDSASGRMRAGAQEMAARVQKMADASKQITENFLRGLQGTFSGFFQQLFTTGVSSFRGLMDSFKNLVLNTVAELASKRLMDSIFGGAGGAGGLLGKLSGGALLGIGVGAFALSKMFSGQKGPSYRMNNTPTYDAGGMDPRQVAAREALAKNQGPSAAQVRSSVGSALQEGTAVRLFGTFEAMRQSLANIEGLLRAGAMGGGQSASGMDRILGTRSQSLRLAAGVAVVG